eukprot:TRINITY_DN11583_c0_g1_i4.p1 TRINITY_DN11583_c0_g1~~TRINITY_DN11583_c0_g1_i4.p1  ORF type:complete len:499 (-),score=62.10 TRINITY_DN11583_c0_g1_i4:203-1699(-)
MRGCVRAIYCISLTLIVTFGFAVGSDDSDVGVMSSLVAGSTRRLVRRAAPRRSNVAQYSVSRSDILPVAHATAAPADVARIATGRSATSSFVEINRFSDVVNTPAETRSNSEHDTLEVDDYAETLAYTVDDSLRFSESDSGASRVAHGSNDSKIVSGTNSSGNSSGSSSGSGSSESNISSNSTSNTTSSGKTTFMCIIGQLRGLMDGQCENLKANLIDVLHADVALVAPLYPGLNISMTKLLLSPLGANVDLRRLGPEPTPEELWQSIYSKAPASAFKAYEEFGHLGGSTAFGPVFGNGISLLHTFWRSKCLRALERREHKRGHRYDRVVVTRFDLRWLGPHPPLRLLDATSVWVPANSEETGVNDLHAVLPRDVAPQWLGIWGMMLRGELADVVRGDAIRRSWMNAEVLLATLIRDVWKVSVRKFHPIAAEICCATGSDFHCAGDCQGDGFRNKDAGAAANETLEHLREGGAGWRLRPNQREATTQPTTGHDPTDDR